MKDPWPIHLTTTDEVQAQGWAAEARDEDGHLISTHAPFKEGDETIADWILECTRAGETVTFFPVRESDG